MWLKKLKPGFKTMSLKLVYYIVGSWQHKFYINGFWWGFPFSDSFIFFLTLLAFSHILLYCWRRMILMILKMTQLSTLIDLYMSEHKWTRWNRISLNISINRRIWLEPVSICLWTFVYFWFLISVSFLFCLYILMHRCIGFVWSQFLV